MLEDVPHIPEFKDEAEEHEDKSRGKVGVHTNPQVLYTWKGPLRAYIKRSKKIIRFYLALAVLLSLITVFFGNYMLLLVIWTLLFLFYVLTITPPPEVETRITQFGIETVGTTLRWDYLSHFYFGQRFGYEILTVVTHPPYFDHFFIVVPNAEVKTAVIKYLSEHVIFQEHPQKGVVDKMVDWCLKLVPTEDEGEMESLRIDHALSGVMDKLVSVGEALIPHDKKEEKEKESTTSPEASPKPVGHTP